ncbi:carbohydrate deacetylase [Mesobacillus zeae]|nr:ChbG/HpnK family deacetylase [Mesobacillus zeae]
MEQGKKFLIINADDFGLTEGVSEGILHAHGSGIVSSTSVMMNRPFSKEALIKANAYPSLEVGVHLVFNKDRPLLPRECVPSLVDQDGFFHKNVFLNRKKIVLDELYQEFAAQVNDYISLMDRQPSHLDCHHWGILHLPFFKVYLQVGQLFNVPVRVPFFDPKNYPYSSLQELLKDVPLFNLNKRLLRLRSLAADSGLVFADYFCPGFYGSKISLESFKTQLENLPPGTAELMTHPGFADSSLYSASSYNKLRLKELKILTSPGLPEFLLQQDIVLTNYSELKSSALILKNNQEIVK